MLASEAVSNITIDPYDRQDEMDPNTYLRILKVSHKDESMTQYINGVAFFKNVAHKKMKMHLKQPSILLLSGVTEFSGRRPELLSMETVLTEEPDYTKFLLRKLTKLKLALLVVEGSMSQWVISELTRFGVTVLINVKKEVLDMVARVCQGRILSDIEQVGSVQSFIGHCKEVIVRPYERTGIVLIHSETTLGGSILISGPDQAVLRKVKKVLREMVVYARNLRLESSFLAQFGISCSAELENDLKAKEVKFQYMKTSGRLCIKPQNQSICLYSKEDLPLGKWISRLNERLMDNCAACGLLELKHKEHYIRKDRRVTISYTKTETDTEIASFYTICSICGAKSNRESVNLWSWGYSWYRLLVNFFSGRCEKAECGHTFFPNAKLVLIEGYFEAQIESFPSQTFDLLPLTLSLASKNSNSDLVSGTLQRVLTAATYLLTQLMNDLEQLQEQARVVVHDAGNQEFKRELGNTYLVIMTALSEAEETGKCADLLQVEFLKKRLFLEICAIKITIHAHKLALKTGNSDSDSSSLQVIDWTTSLIQERPQTPTRPGDLTLPALGPRRHSAMLQPHNRMILDHHSIIVFPQQWIPLEKTDSFLACPSFMYMSAGNQTLLPGLHDTFTPVWEDDPLTVVAYVLNSQKYHEEVSRLFELTTDLNESIESELLSGSDDSFDMSFSTFDFSDVPGKSDLIRLYGPSVAFHVKVYYVRQFQAMRCYLCPSFLDFVLSMSRSEEEQQHLGKSGAIFFRSNDGKYIGKLIDEREFNMFADMAPNYFRHTCKSFYHNMPSRLVHIVGVYRYSVKNLSQNTKSHSWLLIMRNLDYGISPTAVTYDLKGTLNSRRYVKEGEQQTKMDLNFLEEMDSLPLLLSEESMRVLESAIWNDTLFLSKQNVIDYSLVVIVSRAEGCIAAGVIDYLRQYTFDKAVESQYKKVMKNEVPTITDPTQYKERFRQQVLREYFLALDYR